MKAEIKKTLCKILRIINLTTGRAFWKFMGACSYKHRLVPLSVDSDEEDEEEESHSSREVVTVFPFLSLVFIIK